MTLFRPNRNHHRRRCCSNITTTTTTTTKTTLLLILALSILWLSCGQYYYIVSFPTPKSDSVGAMTSETTTTTGRQVVDQLLSPSLIEKLQQQPQEQSEHKKSRLYYVGRFGLGHRLSKLSAAYHLAVQFNLTELELNWGSCQTREIDIFTFLFGTYRWPVVDHHDSHHSQNNHNNNNDKDKTILVRNDVAGYYAGQSYKNAQRPIPKRYRLDSRNSPWLQKLELDRYLFRTLLTRFLWLHPHVNEFQLNQQFHNHTVIGLHLRMGNGEQDHFTAAKRDAFANTTTADFIQNLCRLLRQTFLSNGDENNNKFLHKGPPLLFLATDTASVIAQVQESCGGSGAGHDGTDARFFSIVSAPQDRVETNQGVSYQAWKSGSNCFQGWVASMTDMALLASADILIAGMRSTFTQILPRSLVQQQQQQQHSGQQHQKLFCEVGTLGERMTCFANETDWLFRPPAAGQTFYYNHHNRNSDNVAPPVVHKVLVHLPDVDENPWLAAATAYLQKPVVVPSAAAAEEVLAYGDRIDTKYRNKGELFREKWTWKEE